VRVTVNGATQELPEVQTVADLVPPQRGVAVAVNGAVVPRSTWADTALRDGDRVEVLTAAQGG
jgi:sulfur carrier protein